jgi:hypothetical protein
VYFWYRYRRNITQCLIERKVEELIQDEQSCERGIVAVSGRHHTIPTD